VHVEMAININDRNVNSSLQLIAKLKQFWFIINWQKFHPQANALKSIDCNMYFSEGYISCVQY